MVDLLGCPFCSSSDVGFGRTGQRWQTVACNECGAEGPCTEIDRDLIIQKWNTRSPVVAATPRELALEVALKTARAYMDVSLGSPSWTGPNPYPIIDAALALPPAVAQATPEGVVYRRMYENAIPQGRRYVDGRHQISIAKFDTVEQARELCDQHNFEIVIASDVGGSKQP